MTNDVNGEVFLGIGSGMGPAPRSTAADAEGWDDIFRAVAAERGDNPPAAKAGKPGQSLHFKRQTAVGFRIGSGPSTEPSAEASAAYFVEALQVARGSKPESKTVQTNRSL